MHHSRDWLETILNDFVWIVFSRFVDASEADNVRMGDVLTPSLN